MANPRERQIGRTRVKLAALISKEFPELLTPYMLEDGLTWVVDPFLLTPQIPIYASPQFDCCSWDAGFPKRGGGTVHMYSWDRMGDLVRLGFDWTQEDQNEIELSARLGTSASKVLKCPRCKKLIAACFPLHGCK